MPSSKKQKLYITATRQAAQILDNMEWKQEEEIEIAKLQTIDKTGSEPIPIVKHAKSRKMRQNIEGIPKITSNPLLITPL